MVEGDGSMLPFGFMCFKNELHEDVAKFMTSFRSGEVRPVMVTGMHGLAKGGKYA